MWILVHTGNIPTTSTLMQPTSTLLPPISSSSTLSSLSSISPSPSPSPLSPSTNPTATTTAPVQVPVVQLVVISPPHAVIPVEEGSLELVCLVLLEFSSEGPVGIKWMRKGSLINTTTPIVVSDFIDTTDNTIDYSIFVNLCYVVCRVEFVHIFDHQ